MAEIHSVELNAERAAERARLEQQAAAMTARERARVKRSHRPLTGHAVKIRYRWKDILTCGFVSAVTVVFVLIICNAL